MKKLLFILFILVGYFSKAQNIYPHNFNAPQGALGTIYNKAYWLDTLDFTRNGVQAQAYSSGYINISNSGAGNHATDFLSLLSQHVLPRWKVDIIIKLTTVSGTASYAATGVENFVPAVSSAYVLSKMITTSGSTTVTIEGSTGTLQTGVGPSFSVNDLIEITGDFEDSVYTATFKNLTTASATTTISQTFAAGGSPVMASFCKFGISQGGNGYQIRSVTITSNTIANPNLLVLGNSISQEYYSNSIRGGYSYQLNATYPNTVQFAGTGGQGANIEQSLPMILSLRPAQVILASPMQNPLRISGITIAQAIVTFDSIVNVLNASGARVAVWNSPEDSTISSGANLTAFDNWLRANVASRGVTYIDVWDSVSTSNKQKSIYGHGDGIHYNQAGNDKIYEAIVASKWILNTSDRRAQFTASDGLIKLTSDSIYADSATLATRIKQVASSIVGISGSGVANQAAYWNSTTGLTGATNFIVDPTNGGFNVNASGSSLNRGLGVYQNSADVFSAQFFGKKSRGSFASPSVITNGDYGMAIINYFYDGGAYNNSALLTFHSNGTVGSGSTPTDFEVWTGATGNGTKHFTVNAAGTTILFPSTTSGASLNIAGGTSPSSPNAGDIWSDGTSTILKTYHWSPAVTLTNDLGTSSLGWRHLYIAEGANGRAGQTTLVSGTKAITITGITTSSRAFVTLVTPSGVTLTTTYQAVCTANTLTIQANVAAGTINAADGSTLNYFVIN